MQVENTDTNAKNVMKGHHSAIVSKDLYAFHIFERFAAGNSLGKISVSLAG